MGSLGGSVPPAQPRSGLGEQISGRGRGGGGEFCQGVPRGGGGSAGTPPGQARLRHPAQAYLGTPSSRGSHRNKKRTALG